MLLFEMSRRRARLVLIAFGLLAVLAGSAGPTLFDKVSGGGYADPGADSSVAADLLRDEFGQAAPNLVLVVTAPDAVSAERSAAAGRQLVERLRGEPDIGDVLSFWTDGLAPLRSKDGHRALIVGSIIGSEEQVDRRVDALVETYGGEHDGLRVEVGGNAVLLHETVQQTEKDLVVGESIAFPITLIALVLVFGGVAAGIPLVVATVTVLFTVGVLWVMAVGMDLAATSTNVASLLGLGLAIDYSLLIVSRFREELQAGAEPPAALERTLRSAGRTVAFSAVTVAVVLSSLLFFPLLAVRSMAYAGIAVALLAAAVSLILLPAILFLLGRRIDRGRVRRFGRVPVPGERGAWHRLAEFVMRRPIPIGLAIAAVLVVVGIPALRMNPGFPDERSLPDSMVSRQVMDTVRADFDFPDQNAPIVVLPETTDDLAGYATALTKVPGVQRVDTRLGSFADGRLLFGPAALHQRFAGTGGATYLLVVPVADTLPELQQLVRDIRAVPAPTRAYVGGIAAAGEDAIDAVTRTTPVALLYVVLAMLVLLFLMTGSVVLPLIAILLSALSLTATFGAIVLIFQDGHGAGLFGVAVTGEVGYTLPIMLFALAFGLAMDYQVFLLERIREEYLRTGDPTAAVALGLEHTGRIVTTAAILISLVFLGFLASGIAFIKAFGVGLPIAVLVDATLIRGFLLPAVMKLAGEKAWWSPPPLRALHRRLNPAHRSLISSRL